MRVLRNIYTFVTGGSIAAPVGLALAICATFALPHARAAAFVACIALTFVASTFERVR